VHSTNSIKGTSNPLLSVIENFSIKKFLLTEVQESFYCSLDFVEAVNIEPQSLCEEAVLRRIDKIIIKEDTKIAKKFQTYRGIFERNGIDYELVEK